MIKYLVVNEKNDGTRMESIVEADSPEQAMLLDFHNEDIAKNNEEEFVSTVGIFEVSCVNLTEDMLKAQSDSSKEQNVEVYYLFFKEGEFRKIKEEESTNLIFEIKEKIKFSEEGSEIMTLGRNKTEFLFWTTNKNNQLISTIKKYFKGLKENGMNNTEWSNYFYDSYQFFSEIIDIKPDKITLRLF